MTETTTLKKTSLTQRAFGMFILNAALLLVNLIKIFLLNQPWLTDTAANYATVIPIRQAINTFCIIILLAAFILSEIQSSNPEKEDELAKLHKYKAGYISFYIFLLAVTFLIYIVKNFEPAFIGDFIDKTNLACILFAFSQCLQNIVFIYLEKRSLE